MGRKLRSVLIFLLIILKESNMPEGSCSCKLSPSQSRASFCKQGLTSIPQDLPASIHALQELHLNHNQITTIAPGTFANLPQLRLLHLHNNRLTTIDSGTFPKRNKLKTLTLGYNQITTIAPGALANLARLRLLFLQNNQITTFDPGAFVFWLQELHLHSNQITTIPPDTFANTPWLEILKLNNNTITTIHLGTFQNLTNLRHFWLSQNQISTIYSGTFANLRKLQLLYLNNNQITYIPSGTFANLPDLKLLHLHDNKIISIHSGAFANLPQLQELDLHNNQITTIHCDAFANLSKLRNLCLNNNQITTILSGTFANLAHENIQYVDLRENPWQCDCRMAPVRLNPAFNDPMLLTLIRCAQPTRVKGQRFVDVNLKELTCKEPTVTPLTVDSCSAAVSTPSVGNTEGNTTSPSVYKHTTWSTANPAENISKTRVTLTSPLDASSSDKAESAPSSPQPTKFTQIAVHWCFKFNAAPMSDSASKTRATLASPPAITSEKPESAPNSPLLVLIRSICGSVVGLIVLIGTIIFTVWYKRKSRSPPLGLHPKVVVSNTDTAVSVSASGDDQRYVDSDHLRVQRGQGQGNIPSLNIGNLSYNQVLAALIPNPMYAGKGNTAVSVMASGDDHHYEDVDNIRAKTGQGQSQAITASNTTATVMASGDYHEYEDVDKPRVKTGQGQSRAITASNTTATVMASGDDATCVGQGQYQPLCKASTNTTAVTTSGDDQTGQATVMTSGNDAIGPQGQYQPLIEANTNTTATVMASGLDQTGQGPHIKQTTANTTTANCDNQW
ncbi:hypothetical protein Bbelb_246550 [Branchiostoma belcheri]|nr:hypothetical protein Bbelb_246550 [Branchiostoma belcheri]